MALNFQGIGFSFAAKDDGLLTYQRQVLSGFDAINDQVAKMNKGGGGMRPPGGGGPGGGGPGMGMPEIPDPSKKAGKWAAFGATVKKSMGGVFTSTRSANKELIGMADVGHKLRAILGQLRLGNLLEGLSLSNLNQISDTVEKLGSAGRNLTTGLEAEFVSMGKTSKATFANMGYGADQIKKLSGKAAGMAKGMNIDIGKATESLYAMTFAEEEFAALGVKSAKDLAKFSEVTGTDMKATATALKTMSDGYGISNEALNQLTSSTLAFGQQSGDVGAAIGKLPALMEQLSKTTDRYGNVLRGADLAAFAQESVALSAGFYSIYKDAGKAEAATAAITQALAAGRAGYSDLFTGVQSDMPQILTDLSIVGGDFSKAFDMLQSGPENFSTALVEMSKEVARTEGGEAKLKKFAATMQSRLKASLGEEAAAALADMMAQGGDGIQEVMKKSHEATTTISEIGKAGFSSGRTLAESMQLAEDSMEMRFRKIGMGSTRTFVTEAQKNFKVFGDQMEGLAAAGGPMAAVITKLSEISSQGATAFLPDSLKPAAALFGNLLKTMGPALGIMGSLGFRFSMLLSPLTLLAAPLGILAVLFGDLVMKTYDAETKTYDFAKAFDQLGDKVNEWIKMAPGLFNKFVGVLKTIGVWVRDKLPGILEQGFLHGIDFVKWITESLRSSDWSLAGTTFFDKFGALFATGGSGDVLLQNLKAMFEVLIPKVATLLGDLLATVDWAGLGKTVAGFLGSVWNTAFGDAPSGDTGPIAKALGELIKKAWGAITDLASGFWEQLKVEFGTGGAAALVAGAALAMSPLLRTLTLGAFQLALQGIVIPLFQLMTTQLLWPALVKLGLWMKVTAAPAVGGWISTMFATALAGAKIVGSMALSFGSAVLSAITTAIASVGASLAAIGGGGIAAALAGGVATFFATKKLLEWTGLDKALENIGGKIYDFFHKDEAVQRTTVRGGPAPMFNMQAAAAAAAAEKAAADPAPWSMTADAAGAASTGMFNMMGNLTPLTAGTASAGEAVGGLATQTERAAVQATNINGAMSMLPTILGKNKKNTEQYTKGFQEFVTGLTGIWYKGIDAMLLAMDAMVVAVLEDSATLNAEVTRMTQALIAVQKERETTLAMTAASAPPIMSVPGMEELPENFKVLAQMINEPAWYARYEILFARKMDELRVDVQRLSNGSTVTGGPRGPSRSSGARQALDSQLKDRAGK